MVFSNTNILILVTLRMGGSNLMTQSSGKINLFSSKSSINQFSKGMSLQNH